jgi:hypothetical protein
MRIASVTIRNYRSLKDVIIRADKYSAFIGANGSGKSSVLYALDWFFNGTPLTDADAHGYKEGDVLGPEVTVEVAVTFIDLTDKDRDRLQQYGRTDRAEIRRTWYAATNQIKTVGNAIQGPGFAEVRMDQAIATRRQKYRGLRTVYDDLPELPSSMSKDAIMDALSTWESEPVHASLLAEVRDVDANQMMGWNGTNVLHECVRFVLIPAATSIAGEVGSISRGSALTELIGAFMASASARAQAVWLERNADAVEELAQEMRDRIESATGVQETRVNVRLASLIPNASVTLTPTVPTFAPKLDPSISTAVTISGATNDVARQGHGVQRAVMISMFQAMVPDEDLMRNTHEVQEGEDEAASQARLQESVLGLPSIVVAIEEPEIYQHPVRARSFARTLVDLSAQDGVQVLLATHSPYFIQPEQFTALRRFTYAEGETRVSAASVDEVARSYDLDEDRIEKAIVASVSSEFSEGFFADGVVLVEGATDRVVVEAIAAKLGKDLDWLGVTVLSVEGKAGLLLARAILDSFGIPTYVLADGDFGTASRRTYRDKTESEAAAARAQAHASHKKATEELVAGLPAASVVVSGSLPYSFGDQSVVCEGFAIWRDDIEEELLAWASFESALREEDISLAARNNKNLLAYRNAVRAADKNDLPQIFIDLVGQLELLVGKQ